MMTLLKFSESLATVPTATAWHLADLGEACGRQQLFVHQAPQRLKTLREHAMIESAVSSNRIEGVTVERARVGTVVFGNPPFRDRDEEEVHGYREALSLIHSKGANLPVSEETILKLHHLARGGVGYAGQYKAKDSEIIETHANGRVRVRFKTVSAKRTPKEMTRLVDLWEDCSRESRVPPLVALAAFDLDFLCIHPFRDGNGRVSRLLLLLQLYHLGFEVGRYVALERLIEENKDRYYETLEASSQGWHEGRHDPWPYVNHLLYILKLAYQEFEDRLGQPSAPKGEKTALIIRAVSQTRGPFRVSELQQQCPEVSVDMIRHVLKNLRSEGRVSCLGRGQNAHWERTGELGNTH
jgi:Fic family protein